MARNAALSEDSGLRPSGKAARGQTPEGKAGPARRDAPKARRQAPPPEEDEELEDEELEGEEDLAADDGNEGEEDEPEMLGRHRRSLLNSAFIRTFGSIIASMTFHLVALITLALTVLEPVIEKKLNPIVANLVHERDPEFVEVELDQQIEAATEQAMSVTQQSINVASVAVSAGGGGGGGSGEGFGGGSAGGLALDTAVVARSEVGEIGIAGLEAIGPPGNKIIEEVPEGFLGDPRAIVEDYQEAMDRITQEILLNLQKSDVLLVWCFDQSESMKDDQREIRDRIYRVYEELGLVNASNNDALTTAVTSYGEGFLVHTKAPTEEVGKIKVAIEEVPSDPSGKEMMCSAVTASINLHREYAKRTHRRMLLVLVTDESGERPDNDANMESTVAMALAAQCKIYTLGREAVFGYPYAFMRWLHPQTKRHHWLRIDRGPETAFVEQLQTNGFYRRHDAFPSGFGPYEETRLSRETGGIFFMLPSLETNLVHGHKGDYDLDVMRPYKPDLRSRAECFFDRDKSRIQTTLWDIIYTFNPYNPKAAEYIELQHHFSINHVELVKQVQRQLPKLPPYINALAAASQTVEKLQYDREQETDPRWQANYDLLRAHLVAYQARVYEYGTYLQQFAQKPDIVPLTKSPNLILEDWELGTRKETLTEESRPYIERATALYQTVIQNHPGTPWAAMAQQELNRGYGVKLYPDYEPPLPKVSNPIPIPNL